jgi:hypothetical protein
MDSIETIFSNEILNLFSNWQSPRRAAKKHPGSSAALREPGLFWFFVDLVAGK